MREKIFTFGIDADSQKLLKMFQDEWMERMNKVRAEYVRSVAERVLTSLQDRIPGKAEYDSYRDSLEVVGVKGNGNESVFAVRSSPHSRGVTKVDVPRTVLYIRPRRKLSRIRPEIKILEQHNPWTVNTLPFTPKRSHAQVISRRVQQREVERIEKDRKEDRKVWRRELAKVGIREPSRSKRTKVPKRIKTIPDVAFEALRLEFGMGGVKAEPHWRPGIRAVMGRHVDKIGNLADRIEALTEPRFRKWKQWPQRTKKISLNEARRFVGFQKKLNIRVG